MKRPLKKSIAFLLFMALSLQLVFTATPNKVSAASSAPFEVYNGYISQYNGTDPNWVIPETDATGISLYYDEVLESIVIPEGIKEVSLYCITKLKKITFLNILLTTNIIKILKKMKKLYLEILRYQKLFAQKN